MGKWVHLELMHMHRKRQSFTKTTIILFVSTKSVTLLHDLKGKGYCLTTYNYYTSSELTELLISSKTDICGTLIPNQKGLPALLKSSSVKKGKIIAFQKGKMCVMKWKDKKPPHMLSTFHNADMMELNGKKENLAVKMKPKAVVLFNATMSGVDRSDQSCRGKQTCSRCASIDHTASDCDSVEPRCDQPHPAESKDCPQWKKEKQIQELRTKNNISYFEAKNILFPKQSRISYSTALKSTNVQSTQTDEKITKVDVPPIVKLKPLTVRSLRAQQSTPTEKPNVFLSKEARQIVNEKMPKSGVSYSSALKSKLQPLSTSTSETQTDELLTKSVIPPLKKLVSIRNGTLPNVTSSISQKSSLTDSASPSPLGAMPHKEGFLSFAVALLFSGYSGCPWCLHPGVSIEGVIKYVTQEEGPELRTEREAQNIMQKFLKEEKSIIKESTEGKTLKKPDDFHRSYCT
ncbi:unnamed protein product [Larinioides sclopetarius]|uniref:PiggyBac transposable element-derived protein domain-containing protein n=1 Tax=Larinioides sclopetarius TaxID=280406 RepID=A0AAV2AA97_9ARAC